MKHTLRDVAKLAGVSVWTASAVVNNKDGVSDRLRKRVAEAMQALDYHPDFVARSLRVRCTHTIGIVIPDITNPFFTDLISGAETEAGKNGYSVILCDSGEDPARERNNLNNLFSRRVDGVVLAPATCETVQDTLIQRRFPIVLVDRVPPDYKGSAVLTDNFGASYEATRHLISLGHQRIAIITGRLELSNGRDRYEGFCKAMQEAGILVRDQYVAHGDFQLESGYRHGLELLRLLDPPTAIFACNNKMTLGLMRALRELHVSCPERVSVLGFDDFDWAANFSPRLTTVAQATYQMGVKSMEILLSKLRTMKGSPGVSKDTVVTLKAPLCVRDSTAPPYTAAAGG